MTTDFVPRLLSDSPVFKAEVARATAAALASQATIASFKTAASFVITVDMVSTFCYEIPGDGGGAIYIADASVTPAYVAANPVTSFISSNNRGFRLYGDLGIKAESFGAKGDGITNDTDAMIALSAFITAAGGGKLKLRPNATYIVGKQSFLAGVASTQAGGISTYYSYSPAPIIRLVDLTKPLIIRGNGAKFLAATGLRYGTFNKTTGVATNNPMPYMGDEGTTPYEAMIHIQNCKSLDISNLELDGNCDSYTWGGQRGDTGYQITCVGLLAQFNGATTINNVYSHHHGQDGIEAAVGVYNQGTYPLASFSVKNSNFDFNCRLGGNLRGAIGAVYDNCTFDNNAMGPHFSAPAAGFDLEAETGVIANITFNNCKFRNNRYSNMASDSGDIRDVTFNRCILFSGVSGGNSFYTSRPRFQYYDCIFAPPFVLLNGYPYEAKDQPRFERCLFTDDATYSIDGTVNVGQGQSNVNNGATLFYDCVIRYDVAPLMGFANDNMGLVNTHLEIRNGEYRTMQGTLRNCTLIIPGLDIVSSDKLHFADEFTVVNGVPHAKTIGITSAAAQGLQPASAATTLAGLTADFNNMVTAFNNLNAALKNSGMENPA